MCILQGKARAAARASDLFKGLISGQLFDQSLTNMWGFTKAQWEERNYPTQTNVTLGSTWGKKEIPNERTYFHTGDGKYPTQSQERQFVTPVKEEEAEKHL